jgi:hypothetical protein
MRLALAILPTLLLVAGGGHAGRPSPEHLAVSAVVLDEASREEVAKAVQAGESAEDAMARVEDGPKNQAPIPD